MVEEAKEEVEEVVQEETTTTNKITQIEKMRLLISARIETIQINTIKDTIKVVIVADTIPVLQVLLEFFFRVITKVLTIKEVLVVTNKLIRITEGITSMIIAEITRTRDIKGIIKIKVIKEIIKIRVTRGIIMTIRDLRTIRIIEMMDTRVAVVIEEDAFRAVGIKEQIETQITKGVAGARDPIDTN